MINELNVYGEYYSEYLPYMAMRRGSKDIVSEWTSKASGGNLKPKYIKDSIEALLDDDREIFSRRIKLQLSSNK